MTTIDKLFSGLMFAFGLFVMLVSNAAIYAPDEAVGYGVTMGFLCSMVGLYHFRIDDESSSGE